MKKKSNHVISHRSLDTFAPLFFVRLAMKTSWIQLGVGKHSGKENGAIW